MLQLGLLGEMRVSLQGRPSSLPRSKKTRALLAYLALTGGTHRRERLCNLFWDVPDDPRGALRWSLSKLRGVVDEPDASRIVADRETVAFNRSSAAIDVVDLRARLSGDLRDIDTKTLVAAASEFRGEVLEGLDLPECHEFHAWCVAQRADARDLQARIAATLVERFAGNPEAALPHARTLVLIESEREAHWASLARLLAAAGRRREAEEQSALGLRVLESAGMPATGPLLKVVRNLRKSRPASSPAAEPPAEQRLEPTAARGDPRIVVLPFRNLGTAAEYDHFADGITEDLTTTLTRVLGLYVVARSTALAFKDPSDRITEIARSLGVRYALHGSVRVSDAHVRVNAFLIDALTDSEVWAEVFDVPLVGVFDVQDCITTSVMQALQIKLLEGERARIWHRTAHSVEAWSYLTQGLARYRHQTREGVNQARALFARATELDPDYAAAWAWLAYAHWHDARFHWTDEPALALERASQCAARAMQIDGEFGEVHAITAAIQLLRRDYDAAIRSGRTAFSLNPSCAETPALMAFVLNWSGEPQEALWFADKAVTACPLHATWHLAVRAHSLRLLKRFDDAVEAYQEAVNALPHYIMPRIGFATCLAEIGEIEAARRQAEAALRINPAFSIARHTGMSAYRRQEHTLRRLAGMRAAGLPD
jgi:TolB-like protein/DNA-binding SARP family transcriptional activator